jgi:hypothetical protein
MTVLQAVGRIVREYFLLPQVLPKVKEPQAQTSLRMLYIWNLEQILPAYRDLFSGRT